MPRTGFSLIIVPESTGKVIKKTIAKWKVITALVVSVLVISCSAFCAIGYFKAKIDSQKLISLNEENQYLEANILKLQQTVEFIKGKMSDIIQTDEKIRLVFDMPSIDPAIREVGVGGPEFGTTEYDTRASEELGFVEKDIDKILRQINLENASFEDLYGKIQAKKSRLDHTPSIIPCEGLITSGIGVRKDPFTGLMAMHNGIDIATNKGTPVYAPAAGTIVDCGWDRGMGNFIVIDHGNDLRTYYGHLSLIKVRNGQYVQRMDILGLVGSTGRSTGPHLHYEIRSYNRPLNPREYFVNSIIYNS